MIRKLLLSAIAALAVSAPATAGSLSFGFSTGSHHGANVGLLYNLMDLGRPYGGVRPYHHPHDPYRPHPPKPYSHGYHGMPLYFDCVVAGGPRAWPRDIWISNPYRFPTEPGIRVAYAVPNGDRGSVVIPGLAPGQGVMIRNAIRHGVTPGQPCKAVAR